MRPPVPTPPPCAARRSFFITVVAASLVAVAACQEQDIQQDVVFASPSGLALGGTEVRRLFVANLGEDTVQVLTLGEDLFCDTSDSDSCTDIDFVRSPAQYFPLRIPAGGAPSAMAGTPAPPGAQSGRWVVVLDSATDSLGVIDGDALAPVRGSDGEAYRFVAGPAGARPSGLKAAKTTCETPCAGLFYVPLSGAGAILEVELREVVVGEDGTETTVSVPGDPSATARLVERRVFDVGGAPREIALSEDGRLLFASDGSAGEVIRLDLIAGVVQRLPVGAAPGAIAVSVDGTMLLVARPSFLDVVVIDGAGSGDLIPFDADPMWAPAPVCVPTCTPAPEGVEPVVCDTAAVQHPGDRALCTTGSGLQSVGQPYSALYVGTAPTLIETFGTRPGDDAELLIGRTCRPEGAEEALEAERYRQSAAVVLLDGRIVFVTLRDEAGVRDVGILEQAWCQPPSIVPSSEENPVAPDALFGPCPEVPDRQRFECAGGHVIVMPGITRGKDLSLDWEGVLVNREGGGGTATADGAFEDNQTGFRSAGVQPNDILEVLSTPLGASECTDVTGGATDPCVFERRIVGFDGQSDRLLLDRPLPTACFEDRSIAYKVRAGDQYLVQTGAGRGESPVERIGVGDLYGPGALVGNRQRMLFSIRADLDDRSTEDACDRYPVDLDLSQPFVRDRPLFYAVRDNFFPVLSGVGFTPDDPTDREAIARLPTAIVVAPQGATPNPSQTAAGLTSGPVVFVAYGGDPDSVLAVAPFDVDLMIDTLNQTADYTRLLR